MSAAVPFTSGGDPRAEERVGRDLERIVDAVRAEAPDELLAVLLLGGYARGEGTVIAGPDGGARGFNDYDLLLVFAGEPPRPERWAELGRALAAELGIDFVDLGLVSRSGTAAPPATLFWYELGEAHRVLWSRPGETVPLPRFRPEELEPEEGMRLLVNRGMAHLWGGLRLWPQGLPGGGPVTGDEDELRFAAIAAHKAVLAAGDAALLRSRAYSVRQEERLEVLRARPELRAWERPGFLAAYEAAAAFRRVPRVARGEEAARLWEEARGHHEAGLRAAEEVRLGAAIPSWAEHARLVRKRARRGPREALRAARRWLRGRTASGEEERLLEMIALLHDPGPGAAPGGGAGWRDAARALVRAWHP